MSGPAAFGEPLPERVVVVRADRMAVVTALMDDPVPIHYDRDAVRELGRGDRLVNQGPIALGYLAETVRDWVGERGTLAGLRARFLVPVVEVDRLTCVGAVTETTATPPTATVALLLRRGTEIVVRGSALVRWTAAEDERAGAER